MAVGRRVLLSVDCSGYQSSGPKVPDPSLCLTPSFLPEMPIPTGWLNDNIKILMMLLARMPLGSVSPHLPGSSRDEAPFSCPHSRPHHGTSCAPSPLKDPPALPPGLPYIPPTIPKPLNLLGSLALASLNPGWCSTGLGCKAVGKGAPVGCD